MKTNNFLMMVEDCQDLSVLKNVIEILMTECVCMGNITQMFDGIKSAYSELAGSINYNEEMADLYLQASHIKPSIKDEAILVYNTNSIKKQYPNINQSDWLVLYARMSLNNTSKESILNACKMFLDNKFNVWNYINV